MNRKPLGILAIVIVAVMAIVATAGLDNLPRDLKTSVGAAAARVSSDRGTLDQQRSAIERALREEPALFRTQAASWQTRMGQAQAQIGKAEAELAAVKKLTEDDRRENTKKVEEGLAHLESLRTAGLNEVKQIRADAERWLNYKRNLPAQLQAMNADYEAVRAFDPESGTAAARKAMLDWPAKRPDLEARLTALTEVKSRAEQVWSTSATVRAQAAGDNPEAIDYPAVFGAADQMDQLERQTREGAGTVNQLAGQLYVNWDKLLLEVDKDKQKIRFVRTRYPDATLQNGQVSQEEKWEPIQRAQAEQLERNVGMVVARKPTGKYESEVESALQAPGYAYIAPPGQANSYGSWNNGVWSWLPQYLILSHMLRGPSMPPITMGDYGSYQQARQRGEVYYGQNTRQSGGMLRRTIDRVRGRDQEVARANDGYRGSRYENRGAYSGSRYQSRSSGGFRSYSRGMGGFRRGGRR